ncbi:uncharacterized protein LOC115778696 [Archocentrus centrarchus]|uniref:uncharacterized protein LOC115778696 n=1 Tax=Archocentrus centrarchus TaxID=63155 RepID=UPI0011EA4759|nr:uncharacterized protein LOC115778696 [Archocentrus centrarchus]
MSSVPDPNEAANLEVRSECKASSARSMSSRRSCKSHASQAAAEARAKAEAARTRAEFARRQIDMEVERARLDATLNALKEEGEAEAALAAAKVLETAAVNEDSKSEVGITGPPLASAVSRQRTDEYINTHFGHQQDEMKDSSQTRPVGATYSRQPNVQPLSSYTSRRFQDTEATHHVSLKAYGPLSPHSKNTMNTPHEVGGKPTQISTDISDLAAFLARRDLLSTGVKVFDNRPENYTSWKSTFCSAIEGLNLRPSEELDLLTKWLGGESLQHALRIRAVHINNPAVGLERLWQRLNKNYGSPEVIEASLFKRLENFPKFSAKDSRQLLELADLLLEVETAKNEGYLSGLNFLDSARGINSIVEKLPHYLQESWVAQGTRYKQEHLVHYPPFSFFVNFINYHAEMKTDPSFSLESSSAAPPKSERTLEKQWKAKFPVSANKTEIEASKSADNKKLCMDPDKLCPIHKKPHSLKKCRGFRMKTLDERKSFLREHSICYKCCMSVTHKARDCKAVTHCSECNSDLHISALHDGPPPWMIRESSISTEEHDRKQTDHGSPITTSSCTEVCGEGLHGKSCAKVCLVNVYPKDCPEQKKKMYVILDDQSNVSLARSAFFDVFNIQGPVSPYTLKTCSGITNTSGRRAMGFIIEALHGGVPLALPTLVECNLIPNNREEIPTPEAATHYPHLRPIAGKIPPLDPVAEILLLLGRDIIRVHKVRSHCNGPHNAPYAQRLDLGWVIIGDVCLKGAHKPNVNAFKTSILENGRPSFFRPCVNHISVKERFTSDQATAPTEKLGQDNLGKQIFSRTIEDNQVAPSVEDKLFLHIMNEEFSKDESNSWVAPLPFRSPRQRLPNNREQALKRLMSLRHTLKKKPEMRDHYVQFMEKIFSNGHAEPAPTLEHGDECWYLPSFGVYHPQKPGQIRVVFDSSAQYNNVSLNDVLLKGPDLNNSLIGVLVRFRCEPFAVMADIQQMFHSFLVKEEHRDYLRFLWFHEHNLDGDIVEFRMKVHVFGNCPSPAVAIYGLKRTAMEGEGEYGADTRLFVERHFYVDDGLKSFATTKEAIDVLKKAQCMLAQSNLRLHKIASNSAEVMGAFTDEDLAKELQGLVFGEDFAPPQRSLGLGWDLSSDSFTFRVDLSERPFTKRGVLSTVNSLYDPLGFATPVSIEGRLILRDITSIACDWDAPLPKDSYEKWQRWRVSLQDLKELKLPRMYTSLPLSKAKRKVMFVFCDASIKAVAAVAYLSVTDGEGHSEVGFIFGKAKLAPKPEITVPRLELCAAVLAVEIAELLQEELDMTLDDVQFFTDSRVVLGYIVSESRRFYVYVHNRVQRIKQSTKASQWNYVSTNNNPADHATRSLPANQLSFSSWLTGPNFLTEVAQSRCCKESFGLVEPDSDPEVRSEGTTCVTSLAHNTFSSVRFERFSTWKTLVRAVSLLKHIAKSFSHGFKHDVCHGWHRCNMHLGEEQLNQAKATIIFTVQREAYSDEVRCLQHGQSVSKSSPLSKLHVFVDVSQLLRVGGRLTQAQLTSDESHPMLIPGRHHVALLLVRHFHKRTCHQGRHFTEGAVRAAGFWIVGGKRLISSVIFHCVICRRLRGRQEEQIMADLPADRLSTDPPFTNVGLDVFGPWVVVTRRTRGGQANDKRWAVIFTCMSTRAIHIEVIESMDTSSFINALRRFFAIRGPVKQLRSDCGTNFVSACRELQITKKGCDNRQIGSYLLDQGCRWLFNPPHGSHMGGSWERMIGIARRILDAMLLEQGSAKLTHDVLVTLMAEVTAIVNSRPLTPVSTDSDQPIILTPAMLLTQKVGTAPVPLGQFNGADLFRNQWRRVQSLANTFWDRWKKEYINELQGRRKWRTERPNLQEGDVVLLKDSQVKRNDWPVALVTRTFPSQDDKVRKIEVRIVKNGEQRLFLRPVTEVVLLVSKETI